MNASSLRNRRVNRLTGSDEISSMGSFAPTLANLSTGCNNPGDQNDRDILKKLSEVRIHASRCDVSTAKSDGRTGDDDTHTVMGYEIVSSCENEDSDSVSSVGSYAPTLATKRSTQTLRNSLITVKETGMDEEDPDSNIGMSSSGMSRASTIAHRSLFSGQVVSRDEHSVRGSVPVIYNNIDANDDTSTVGSVAPTLAAVRRRELATPSISENPAFAQPAQQHKAPCTMPKRFLSSGSIKSSNDARSGIDALSIHRQNLVSEGLSFENYASDMALLGGVLGREDLKNGLEDVIGSFLKKGAMVGLGIWFFLLSVIVAVAPLSSYQYQSAPEQTANALLLILLLGANLNRLGPILVNDRKCNWSLLTSGSMMACVTIQFMACSSVALMLFLPTPVVVDPVMGVRCHLVRWAEWTSVAFVMCFLTESIDLPLEDADAKHAWFTAISIACSTVCGGILGFCRTASAWWTVFLVSCLLFSILYVRLFWRGVRLLRMKTAITTAEKEDYERAKYSFKLMAICAFIWTILVAAWTVCALMYPMAKPGSFFAQDWLILATENVCEGLSKIVYLSILMEVHQLLFDDVAETARRLGELRAYMSAVWDASTDVVIICSSHKHVVNAAVSPSFYQLETAFGYHATRKEKATVSSDKTTLVMEVDPYEGSYRTYGMDLSKPMSRQAASKMLESNRTKARIVTPVFQKNLEVLSDLVCDSCTLSAPGGGTEYRVKKEFYCQDKDGNQETLTCEAKVTQLKGKAVLIVLRDITARSPQQRMSAEMTADTASSSTSDHSKLRVNRQQDDNESASDRPSHSPTTPSPARSDQYSPLDMEGGTRQDCSVCTIL